MQKTHTILTIEQYNNWLLDLDWRTDLNGHMLNFNKSHGFVVTNFKDCFNWFKTKKHAQKYVISLALPKLVQMPLKFGSEI